MLNKYLLKEGRHSRPKKIFMVTGLVSLLIIAASTGFYFLAAYVPSFREPINDFRVKFVIFTNTFDFSGLDAIKLMVCVPVTCLGSLIGGINLVRMTNRKGFLSVLHVIPGIGLVTFIVGALLYFLCPAFVFRNLAFDYSAMVPYYGYVFGAAVWAAGIVIADLFSFFYPIMNYWQFRPIYRAYHQAMRAARTYSAKSRIHHYFYYYWKKKRYDDMLNLLYVEKNANKEVLDVDSYVYFRDGALEHLADEKARQLDELYDTEQYDLLERELRTMTMEKSVPPKIKEPEPKPAPKPVDEGETTFYMVEDEEISGYGKHLIKKGRRKAARRACHEKAKARRAESRASWKAKHGW